jgi:nicotinamidase-related amidase
VKKALLIIDTQVALLESPVYHQDEVLGCIESLIDRARNTDCKVIYIVDDDVVEHNPSRGGIHPRITPLNGDVVIHKTSTSAFFRTELDEVLKSNGIQHLVIVGCKTEYCIDTTCRHAIGLGYDVTLVSDGHSTTGNGVLSAEQIIAHHNRNLDGLDNNEFVIRVLPTVDVTL